MLEALRAGTDPWTVARAWPGLGPPSAVAPILEGAAAGDQDIAAVRRALAAIPSTAQVVDRVADRLNAAGPERVVRRIHYPYPHGQMVQQVNWGVRYLFEVVDEGIDPERLFVGLYNADSRPDRSTLEHLYDAVENGPHPAVAFQQVSRYRVPAAAGRAPTLHAAAAWQTRWSLSVEAERARRACRLLDAGPDVTARVRRWAGLPFSYAIGHGLFVRLRELVQINYFPEATANEDAPFGFLLLLSGIRLRTLPTLDSGEGPRSVAAALAQQGGWFRGPLDAPRYRSLARIHRVDQDDPVLVWLLTWRVLRDAVAWVVGPVVSVGVWGMALIDPGLASGWALGALLAFLIVPTLVVWIEGPRTTPRPAITLGAARDAGLLPVARPRSAVAGGSHLGRALARHAPGQVQDGALRWPARC